MKSAEEEEETNNATAQEINLFYKSLPKCLCAITRKSSEHVCYDDRKHTIFRQFTQKESAWFECNFLVNVLRTATLNSGPQSINLPIRILLIVVRHISHLQWENRFLTRYISISDFFCYPHWPILTFQIICTFPFLVYCTFLDLIYCVIPFPNHYMTNSKFSF